MKASYIIVGLFGLTSLVNGCNKNADSMDTAYIIGLDASVPACGGGYMIVIDGHPNPNNTRNGSYLINESPASFSFTGLKYPTRVRIIWHTNPNCYGAYVDITKMVPFP